MQVSSGARVSGQGGKGRAPQPWRRTRPSRRRRRGSRPTGRGVALSCDPLTKGKMCQKPGRLGAQLAGEFAFYYLSNNPPSRWDLGCEGDGGAAAKVDGGEDVSDSQEITKMDVAQRRPSDASARIPRGKRPFDTTRSTAFIERRRKKALPSVQRGERPKSFSRRRALARRVTVAPDERKRPPRESDHDLGACQVNPTFDRGRETRAEGGLRAVCVVVLVDGRGLPALFAAAGGKHTINTVFTVTVVMSWRAVGALAPPPSQKRRKKRFCEVCGFCPFFSRLALI